MPSFLQFLPEQQSPTLVVASGKQNGGVQIMEPYGDPNYSSFLTPSLEQGEAMTSLAVSPSSNLLAIGTSHGKVRGRAERVVAHLARTYLWST